jgi:hypothetical protein
MPLLDPIPSPVANADFAALEWEPLLALVAGFSASSVGRAAILALVPSTDEEWIVRQHGLTGEVLLLLEEQVSIPLGGLFDPTQLAAKARIPDAALEAAELQSVARLANDIAGAPGGPSARALRTFVFPIGESPITGPVNRAQNSTRRLAGRRRIARAEPHSPRTGAPAARHRRKPARRPPQALG